MLSTSLPKASTVVPSDPGIACLRALTAGILCLYDIPTTARILKQVIPALLLDQSGVEFVFEGRVLLSLREWVTAVT
jgi:hypothetical protein